MESSSGSSSPSSSHSKKRRKSLKQEISAKEGSRPISKSKNSELKHAIKKSTTIHHDHSDSETSSEYIESKSVTSSSESNHEDEKIRRLAMLNRGSTRSFPQDLLDMQLLICLEERPDDRQDVNLILDEDQIQLNENNAPIVALKSEQRKATINRLNMDYIGRILLHIINFILSQQVTRGGNTHLTAHAVGISNQFSIHYSGERILITNLNVGAQCSRATDINLVNIDGSKHIDLKDLKKIGHDGININTILSDFYYPQMIEKLTRVSMALSLGIIGSDDQHYLQQFIQANKDLKKWKKEIINKILTQMEKSRMLRYNQEGIFQLPPIKTEFNNGIIDPVEQKNSKGLTKSYIKKFSNQMKRIGDQKKLNSDCQPSRLTNKIEHLFDKNKKCSSMKRLKRTKEGAILTDQLPANDGSVLSLQLGLTIWNNSTRYHIIGDGNCFFRALFLHRRFHDNLPIDITDPLELRLAVCRYLLANQQNYAELMTNQLEFGGIPGVNTIHEYVQYMASPLPNETDLYPSVDEIMFTAAADFLADRIMLINTAGMVRMYGTLNQEYTNVIFQSHECYANVQASNYNHIGLLELNNEQLGSIQIRHEIPEGINNSNTCPIVLAGGVDEFPIQQEPIDILASFEDDQSSEDGQDLKSEPGRSKNKINNISTNKADRNYPHLLKPINDHLAEINSQNKASKLSSGFSKKEAGRQIMKRSLECCSTIVLQLTNNIVVEDLEEFPLKNVRRNVQDTEYEYLYYSSLQDQLVCVANYLKHKELEQFYLYLRRRHQSLICQRSVVSRALRNLRRNRHPPSPNLPTISMLTKKLNSLMRTLSRLQVIIAIVKSYIRVDKYEAPHPGGCKGTNAYLLMNSINSNTTRTVTIEDIRKQTDNDLHLKQSLNESKLGSLSTKPLEDDLNDIDNTKDSTNIERNVGKDVDSFSTQSLKSDEESFEEVDSDNKKSK